jgi:hypothetical protein
MPRAKADKVVIHRIELGGKERELAEGALAAFQFNRIATPVVAGMSDVSFMITFGALLTFFYPDIVLPKAEDGIDAVTDAIKQGIRQGQERARAEREATGESTLDEATGARDLVGRLIYNLTNPNWSWFR